jgi:hypothetical protein
MSSYQKNSQAEASSSVSNKKRKTVSQKKEQISSPQVSKTPKISPDSQVVFQKSVSIDKVLSQNSKILLKLDTVISLQKAFEVRLDKI